MVEGEEGIRVVVFSRGLGGLRKEFSFPIGRGFLVRENRRFVIGYD